MFSPSRMITSVSVALALASVSSVLAAPAPLVARSAAPSPAFVIYTDKFVSADVLPPATQLAVSSVSADQPKPSLASLMIAHVHRASTSQHCPSSPSLAPPTRLSHTRTSPQTQKRLRSPNTHPRASTSSSPRSGPPTSRPPRALTPSEQRTRWRSS